MNRILYKLHEAYCKHDAAASYEIREANPEYSDYLHVCSCGLVYLDKRLVGNRRLCSDNNIRKEYRAHIIAAAFAQAHDSCVQTCRVNLQTGWQGSAASLHERVGACIPSCLR